MPMPSRAPAGTPTRRHLGSCPSSRNDLPRRLHSTTWPDCPVARSRFEGALTALGSRADAHVILGEQGPLVDRLREAGATVEVPPMPAVAREVRKDSVRPGTLGLMALASPHYVWVLRRRLQELQLNVVHTNSLKAALSGGVACRLAGILVIWHIRDRIALDYRPMAAVRMVGAHHSGRRHRQLVFHAESAPSPSSERRRHEHRDLRPHSGDAPPYRTREAPFRVGILGRFAPRKGRDVFLEPSHAPSRTMTARPGSSVRHVRRGWLRRHPPCPGSAARD